MSNSNSNNSVSYGFIKPTTEQAVYTLVDVIIIILACTPMVRNIIVAQVTLSQWILGALSFAMPVICMVRMFQKQAASRGKK